MSVEESYERLRNLELAALPSLDDLEGWAYSFLASVGMAGRIVPLPSQILEALLRQGALVLFEVTPADAAGWYYVHGVFIDSTTPEEHIEELIAHELSHWWLTCMGVLPALQDHVLDQFMMCWRVPRYAVYELTSRNKGGFAGGVQALVDTFAEVAAPVDTLVRAAMVCRVAMQIMNHRGQRIHVGSGFYEFSLILTEEGQRRVAERALECEQTIQFYSSDFGRTDLVAVPFWCRGELWVVLMAVPPVEEAQVIGW